MVTDWRRVRRVVYARDGGICMKCGTRVSDKNFHVDHIVALANGGAEWDLDNLELSCPLCNLSKGAKP
jgi:5-methylcytosine-specific restriction endonuclease McrA